MAKTAKDYPNNYNGYNPPKHNGIDRATPTGTQVFKGNSNILTGNTGKSSGPHLHTQAGTDVWCQKVINPAPYEFKKGTVVQVGTSPEWGKHVILKVGSKYICYAHLSKNSVSKGQVIEEESFMKPTKSEVGNAHNYLGIADKDLSEKTYQKYMALRENVLYKDVLKKLYDKSKASQSEANRVIKIKDNEIARLEKELAKNPS